jgi:hypothetical protein
MRTQREIDIWDAEKALDTARARASSTYEAIPKDLLPKFGHWRQQQLIKDKYPAAIEAAKAVDIAFENLRKVKAGATALKISDPNIFPTTRQKETFECDNVILWVVEAFDIAHQVQYHNSIYKNMGKDEFIDKFADIVFDMHDLLRRKCGNNPGGL